MRSGAELCPVGLRRLVSKLSATVTSTSHLHWREIADAAELAEEVTAHLALCNEIKSKAFS